ncbi:unnamed protein product [Closterium sp. NIES-53]
MAKVTPVSLWIKFPGVAADYCVWGSLAHVLAPGANKLCVRTRVCVVLGFPLDASGWVFYDPVTHQFFASQDVNFDESVSYFRSRLNRAPPPSHPAPSSVSHVTPQSSPSQRPVPVVSGGAGGAVGEGWGTGAAGPGGVGSRRAGGVRVETFPVVDMAVLIRRPSPASPPGFPSVPQFPHHSSLRPVAADPEVVSAGGTGDIGGVPITAQVQLQPQQERAEEEPQEQQRGQVPRKQPLEESLSLFPWSRRSPLSRAVSQEPRRSRYHADNAFHLVLRSRVPPPILPQPPESSLIVYHDPLSDYLHASRAVVSCVLSALVTHPTAPLLFVTALVTTVSAFASSHRLDYASHLVSDTALSPSSEGVPVFPLEVLEDRQFELGFLVVAVPHLCAMLLAPEGDPDAFDIPIPCTHAEAVSDPRLRTG